ncbi:hypothetical protein ABZT51_49275, partial [Streptomyces sp. NPDC005373]|uniref:hypothetical protein n=2 Tax=unclassified Streptomyces TaxID=2593676 RepID=UPI0033B3DD66
HHLNQDHKPSRDVTEKTSVIDYALRTMEQINGWITSGEACERLEIAWRTLYHLHLHRQSPDFPKPKKIGRTLLGRQKPRIPGGTSTPNVREKKTFVEIRLCIPQQLLVLQP